MNEDLVSVILADSLAAAAPLAAAALGGLLTEAAGSLSVALEGSMLLGAFAAAVAGKATGNLWAAFAAAALAGAALGFLLGAAASFLKAEVFVAGLAANLLAPGLASLLSQAWFGTKGVVVAESLRMGRGGFGAPSGWPLIGRALFGQEGSFYVLAAAAILLAILYGRTVFGLRIRAAGDSGPAGVPGEAARAAGIEPGPYRLAAHIVAGAASGVAGAALASSVAAFVPGISAGRGWIALVAIYLGGKRPGGIVLACLGLGLLFSLANAAQGRASVPVELLQSLPYAATALALIIWKRMKSKA